MNTQELRHQAAVVASYDSYQESQDFLAEADEFGSGFSLESALLLEKSIQKGKRIRRLMSTLPYDFGRERYEK
jgi:hypothetical protein